MFCLLGGNLSRGFHSSWPLLCPHLLSFSSVQDLREECIKLKKRVYDLERQNQLLSALFQQKLQLTTGSLPQVHTIPLSPSPHISAFSILSTSPAVPSVLEPVVLQGEFTYLLYLSLGYGDSPYEWCPFLSSQKVCACL